MKCYHMSGAGNDFMVIDARGKQLDFKALTLQLCPMTHADGFMAVGLSDKADFRLHFYNSDGTRGEMCGNGARCICKFAYDHGIADEEMTVETDAGIVYGWRLGENRYKVKLNNPGVLDLHRREDAAYVELGNPGVPHGVVELPGLTWEMREEIRDRARALRYDPAFPKGANINFYTWLGDGEVRMLTYERGVEDYTLACGTGCGSTAAALWTAGKLPGGKLICHHPGGTLAVTVEAEVGEITSVLLEGPAEVLHTYRIPDGKPARKKKRKLNPRFLVTLGILAVLVAALIWLLIAIFGGKQEQQPAGPHLIPTIATEATAGETEAPATRPTYDGPAMLPQMMDLYLKNPDTVAWVGVQGVTDTGIALEEANTKNLPALCAGCSLDPESAVLVIRDTGTRLRALVKYREASFWQENRELLFNTRFEQRTYQVMAAFTQEKGARDFTQLTSEETFGEAMNDIAGKVLYDTGLSVEYGDRLLILIQNIRGNEEFVLVAKLKTE